MLLLVEDHRALATSLVQGLTEDGFAVHVATTGAEALAELARPELEAIVLDLGLPDLDGMAVLATIRDRGSRVPILVLTARDAVEARIAALEAGADDYVVKPFAYAELVARLRALIRRAGAPRWAPLAVGGVALDPDDLVVRIGDRVLRLTPREHALLAYLLRRRDEVVAREELLEQVFGYKFEPGTNLVNVYIANLRKKLGGDVVTIDAVRGAGFRLRLTERR